MKANKAILFFAGLFLGGILFLAGWSMRGYLGTNATEIVPIKPTPIPTPLQSYSIDSLNQNYNPSTTLNIIEDAKEEEIEEYSSRSFDLEFNPNPNSDEIKNISGQINIPLKGEKFPVVVMLRGYVDPEIYKTGMGTERAADVFAQNGFITVSPDFLGYANSSENAADIFESRFQTYTTTLSVLDSVKQINKWDRENIFLWGHSNGGHIALAILEITQSDYPTTLWAPVSNAFPYSVLYYTDEAADKGKYLRRELSKFEELYDADLFSIHKYFGRINAPVQIHQGSADDAIPLDWSENLKALIESDEDYKHDIDLFIYSDANHNLTPGWDTVIERDLEFFKENLK